MRNAILTATLFASASGLWSPADAGPRHVAQQTSAREAPEYCWDAANPHWFKCSDDPAMKRFVDKHTRQAKAKPSH